MCETWICMVLRDGNARVRPTLCHQLGDSQFGRLSAAHPAIRGDGALAGCQP
jgi:hypothetical protein